MLRQDDYVQVAMQVLREEDSKRERTNKKRKTKLSNDVSLSER
jgi:predicted transcriptional regulator